MKSLSEQGILQKLVIAVILMGILPLLLVLHLLYSQVPALLEETDTQLTIIFMLGSLSCGYLLSRKIIMSMVKLSKDAQAVAQGNLTKKIETSEKNEISEVALYFNRLTGELEKNIEELKASKRVMQNVLLRIGNAMASNQKIEAILELTIESLANALNARSGAIMLLEKEKLRIMVSCGINFERGQPVELRAGEGIIGTAAKERKAQNVSRAQRGQQFDVEVKLGLAHKSIICVPLLYKNKVLGTISAHDKNSEDEFSEDDLILLENLASQTAIAIENSRLHANIERTYIETISALALAVEAKDPYSRGHAKRVSEYVTKIAQEFSLDKETIRMLQHAALLHDIGKIGIKDEILLKRTSLSAEEKRQMHRHAIIGENILKPIHSLEKVAYLVRHHQEQVNGKGYPDGLKSDEMVLSLKILIAADAFDAMTSHRPYRRAMNINEAKKELKKYAGIYFDPKVVEILIKAV